MTMQAVAFTMNTQKSSSVNASQSSKSDMNKGSFDNIISTKSQSATKDNSMSAGSQPAKKVDVINNDSAIKKNVDIADDIDSSEINALVYDSVQGKLCVSVVDSNGEQMMSELDMNALFDEIKSIIAKVLNKSEDEVEKAIEEFGFTLTDIICPQNLQELFVKLQGIESFSDILTDAGANSSWNQLSESIFNMNIQIDDNTVINLLELSDLIASAELSSNEMLVADNNGTGNDNSVIDADIANDGEPELVVNISKDAGEASANSSSNQESIDFAAENANEGLADADEGMIGTTQHNESLFSQFMDRVEASVAQGDAVQNNQLSQLRNIANQVIESIKVNVKPDTTGLEIQLNPEHLGKVNVAIELREGIATANFIVRNEMARLALEVQMQDLKDTFEQQGIKVEAVEVTVSDFSFSDRNNEMSEDGTFGQKNKKPFRSDDEIEAEVFDKQSIEEQLEDGIDIIA